MVKSDYRALGQEGAGAGAHLAHEAPPVIVSRHHRFRQAAFRLNPTEKEKGNDSVSASDPRPKERPLRSIRESMRERNPTQLTRLIRWLHSVSERKPLYRNALRARAHTPITVIHTKNVKVKPQAASKKKAFHGFTLGARRAG